MNAKDQPMDSNFMGVEVSATRESAARDERGASRRVVPWRMPKAAGSRGLTNDASPAPPAPIPLTILALPDPPDIPRMSVSTTMARTIACAN